MTSFWQYKSFVDIRRRFLPGRHQTRVGSLKSTILPFPVAISTYTFEKIASAKIAHYDHTPFWISAGTNKDDLE